VCCKAVVMHRYNVAVDLCVGAADVPCWHAPSMYMPPGAGRWQLAVCLALTLAGHYDFPPGNGVADESNPILLCSSCMHTQTDSSVLQRRQS
jgi:hypothetical protein